jgi:hypothetical protein
MTKGHSFDDLVRQFQQAGESERLKYLIQPETFARLSVFNGGCTAAALDDMSALVWFDLADVPDLNIEFMDAPEALLCVS